MQKSTVTNVLCFKAAIEALHALYGRSNMGNEESHGLVCLMFEPDYLNILQSLYQWSIVGPEDMDESKYLISKKLSEVKQLNLLNCPYPMAYDTYRWYHMLLAAWKMKDSFGTLCIALTFPLSSTS